MDLLQVLDLADIPVKGAETWKNVAEARSANTDRVIKQGVHQVLPSFTKDFSDELKSSTLRNQVESLAALQITEDMGKVAQSEMLLNQTQALVVIGNATTLKGTSSTLTKVAEYIGKDEQPLLTQLPRPPEHAGSGPIRRERGQGS